jgi:hypothetical protein
MRIDSLSNKKYTDKIQSDPAVQQFVSLKIKADSGDEAANSKLEDFLKEQLTAR